MAGLFSIEGIASALMFAGVLRDTFGDASPARRGQDAQLAGTLESVMSKALAGAAKKQYMVTVKQVGSADDRIFYIRKMIHKYRYDPAVREVTSAVLTRKNANGQWAVPEKDWWKEVQAVFRFVRKNVRYTRDTVGRDMYASPKRSLMSKSGDCDCYSILLGSMLQSVGYPVILRIIRTRGNQTWNHIYILVGLPPTRPERWVPLDASVNKPPGFQAPAWMVEEFRDFEV